MPTWEEDIREIVQGLPHDEFTAAVMYTFEKSLSARHPGNNNVRPKIRQTIQKLAKKGEVQLVDHNGLYLRLTKAGHPDLVGLEPAGADVAESDAVESEPGTPDAVPLEKRSSAGYRVSAKDAAEAVQREQQLVTAWKKHLQGLGHMAKRWRIPTTSSSYLYTDVYDVTANVLYEAKGRATRESVRLAIGQLYDYRRYLTKKSLALAVLLPERPSTDMIELLDELGIRLVFLEAGIFHAIPSIGSDPS